MIQIESFSLQTELKKARELLKTSEGEIPTNVLKVINFCCEREIGFILSRNIRVFSCKDARSNRNRLGHTGIPLFDEFKSIVFVGKDTNGKETIIASHCRGHMNIIVEKLSEICSLQGFPRIMEEEDLKRRFVMQFGTVNPMLADLNSNGEIINIFDASLIKPIAQCPGTMMTNAGDHTWGIEFDPALLVNITRNSRVDNIAENDKELQYYEIPQSKNPKSIGIITGNGPDSGIALWNGINSHFVELLGDHFIGDISLPKVSVISLPAMGLSMELDKRQQATMATIEEAIEKMHSNNIELLALACHTTRYFTDKIRALFERDGKRFISMPETTIEYIKNKEVTNLAVIGINYVANLQEYSAYSELKKINVERVSDEVFAKFHDIGYDVKKMKTSTQFFKNLRTC